MKAKRTKNQNDFIHFNNLFFITCANSTVSVFRKEAMGGEKQSNVLVEVLGGDEMLAFPTRFFSGGKRAGVEISLLERSFTN